MTHATELHTDEPALAGLRRVAGTLAAAAALTLSAGLAHARDLTPAPEPRVVEIELDTDSLFWDLCVGPLKAESEDELVARIAAELDDPEALYVLRVPQMPPRWETPETGALYDLHGGLIDRRQLAFTRGTYEQRVERTMLRVLDKLEKERPGARATFEGFWSLSERLSRGEAYARLEQALPFVATDQPAPSADSRRVDRWLDQQDIEDAATALVQTSDGWFFASETDIAALLQPPSQDALAMWPAPAPAGDASESSVQTAQTDEPDASGETGVAPEVAPGGTDIVEIGRRQLASIGGGVPQLSAGPPAPSPRAQRPGGEDEPEQPSGGDTDPPAEEGPLDGATPTLIAGPGFSGPTPQPAAVGDASGMLADMKPIARWSTVPFQDVTGPFTVGVVADHVTGVDKVEFSLNGGPWVPSTFEALNPRTNLREYFVMLDPERLGFDGEVEIRAVVYPEQGLPRVLAGPVNYTGESSNWYGPALDSAGDPTNSLWTGEHSLFLFANAGGTLAEQVIELDAGEYVWGQPPLASPYDEENAGEGLTQLDDRRWAIVRAKPGVAAEDVVIYDTVQSRPWEAPDGSRWGVSYEKVKFEGVTFLNQVDASGELVSGSPRYLTRNIIWLDECIVQGAGQWERNGGFTVSHAFYTNTRFADLKDGTGYHGGFGSGNFVRGCEFERIGNKAIRAAYFVADTSVRNVDSGATNWHSSAISNPLPHDNRVYQNIRMSEIRAKAFAFRSEEWNLNGHRDVLLRDIVVAGDPGSSYLMFLGGAVRNMIIRDSSFDAPEIERVWAYRTNLDPSDPRYFRPEALVFRDVLWNGSEQNIPDPFPMDGVYLLD